MLLCHKSWKKQLVAVTPTIATTDMDAWVENMCSLNDVPLAERLRLKREARSAERAAAELLNEEMSTSSSPNVKKSKEGQVQNINCGRCTSWQPV